MNVKSDGHRGAQVCSEQEIVVLELLRLHLSACESHLFFTEGPRIPYSLLVAEIVRALATDLAIRAGI